MGKLIDLKGLQFSRLTVLEKGPLNKYYATWICRCICGKEITTHSRSLLSGNTQSCGCLRADKGRARFQTHGQSNSRIYHIWENVVGRGTGRCHRKQYFEKGLFVCNRWLKFEFFLEDMGEPPTNRHVIDRIDNTKGYFPENCRWTTYKGSIRNRLPSGRGGIHLVTLNDRTQCLKDWCTELGIKYQTVHARIRKGWTERDALLKPLNH